MSALPTPYDHLLQLIDGIIDTHKTLSSMKIYIDTLSRVFPGAVLEERRSAHIITYHLHLHCQLSEEELHHKHRSLKAQLGKRILLTEGEGHTVCVYARGIPAVAMPA